MVTHPGINPTQQDLRLLQTFGGALQKEIGTTCAVLKETATNYNINTKVSKCRIQKKYKPFNYLFVKAKEAGKQ